MFTHMCSYKPLQEYSNGDRQNSDSLFGHLQVIRSVKCSLTPRKSSIGPGAIQ